MMLRTRMLAASAMLLVSLGACSHTEGSQCPLQYVYEGRTYSSSAVEVHPDLAARLPGEARPTCDGIDPAPVYGVSALDPEDAVAVGREPGVATVVVAEQSTEVARFLELHRVAADPE